MHGNLHHPSSTGSQSLSRHFKRSLKTGKKETNPLGAVAPLNFQRLPCEQSFRWLQRTQAYIPLLFLRFLCRKDAGVACPLALSGCSLSRQPRTGRPAVLSTLQPCCPLDGAASCPWRACLEPRKAWRSSRTVSGDPGVSTVTGTSPLPGGCEIPSLPGSGHPEHSFCSLTAGEA